MSHELEYKTVLVFKGTLLPVHVIDSLINIISQALPVPRYIFRYSPLSCGDAMCTIAASTSFPEPFETPSDRKRLGWVHKQFAGSRHSDHIALLSAYQAWEDAR